MRNSRPIREKSKRSSMGRRRGAADRRLCLLWGPKEQRHRHGGGQGGRERNEEEALEVSHTVVRERLLDQGGTNRVGDQGAYTEDHHVEQPLRAGPRVFREILDR